MNYNINEEGIEPLSSDLQGRPIGNRNDANRYPNDIFVRLILERPEDSEFRRQLQEVFDRLLAQRSITT